jgi:hypothetical protein
VKSGRKGEITKRYITRRAVDGTRELTADF